MVAIDDLYVKYMESKGCSVMIVDFDWTGGFVVGIAHTDQAIVEVEEEQYEMCNAIVISLGLFQIALLFA